MKTKLYYCVLLIVILSLRSFSGFAQTLPAFTLAVTPTAETCTNNGVLSLSTSGTQTGANVVYAIYKSPNYTTAIATTTSASYTGLSGGTYRVVATQTVGVDYSQQTWNGTITSSVVALTFSLAYTNEHCANDGTITVTTTAGTPAAANAYALYDAAGTTVVKAPQTSNVFTGLAAGSYLVKVTDACTQIVTQNVTLNSFPANINLGLWYYTVASCSTMNVNYYFYSGTGYSIVYPLTIKATTHDHSGAVVDVQTITQATDNQTHSTVLENLPYLGRIVSFSNIPIIKNASFSVDYSITDACGKTYTITNSYNFNEKIYAYTYSYGVCNTANPPFISFSSDPTSQSPWTYNITSAPAGYTKPMSGTLANGVTFGDGTAATAIPEGMYTFSVTDACGVKSDFTINLQTTYTYTPDTYNYAYVYQSCEVDKVSIMLQSQPPYYRSFASARIISGPAAYLTMAAANGLGSSYPIAASHYYNDYSNKANISGSQLYMYDVPVGTYVIETTNECGDVVTTTVNAVNNSNDGTITIKAPERNCGSFNVYLNVVGSTTSNDKYYLDFQNTATGNWNRVMTLLNGLDLTSPSTVSGTYRIVKSSTNQMNGQECIKVLKTFTYASNQLAVDELYGFKCPDGVHYNVYVSGKNGIAPYMYKIIAKNGVPLATPIDNGVQNLFIDLTGATYTFEITDNCGNLGTSIVDVTKLSLPKITATTICDGSAGSLSLNGIKYLNFTWTKDSDPTVLSTTATLSFNPFHAATDAGTYHVHVVSSPPGSCVDIILDYVVGATPNSPNAGPDVNLSICNSVASINLNTLLNPAADTYGDYNWVETSAVPSGNLVHDMWSPSASAAGTYTFTYTVYGQCSGSATSTYTIVNAAPPTASIAYGNGLLCTGLGTQPVILKGTDGYKGGTFSSSPAGLTINAATGDITTGTSTPGVYTVTYTVAAPLGCTAVTATCQVTVSAAAAPTVTGAASTCLGSNISLTGSGTPAVTNPWISSDISVATVDNSGTVTSVAAGSAIITYAVTNGCSVSQGITVNTVAITGATSMCLGSGVSLIGLGTPAGVNPWASSNTSVATVDNNGNVTSVAAGSATITYTAATGCQASTGITVNNVTITGATSVCSGGSIALTASGGTAIATNPWVSNNITVATVDNNGNVTGVGAGSVTITYKTTSGCQASKTITVIATPTVAAITGAAGVCPGSTFQLSDATPGGVWASSDNTIATVDVNGLVTGVAGGTANITYAVTNVSGCTTTVTLPVTIKGTGISFIWGSTGSSCVSSQIYLGDDNPGGVWTISDNTIGTIYGPYANGAGHEYIQVNGSAPGTATITYTVPTDPSGCGITTATKVITFNAAPTVAPITGGAVCVGSTTQFSDATPGGVWSTNDATNWPIDATTGLLGPVAQGAGNLWIGYTVTNASGCITQVYKIVTVMGSAALAPITGAVTMCASSVIYLSDASAGGVWSSSDNSVATVDPTTGTVTGVAPGTVTITYAGCSGSVTQNITVTGPAVAAITGVTNFCSGSTTQMSDATAGGYWQSSDGTVATVNSSTGLVTGVNPGTAIISYAVSDASGCSTTVTHPVTVTGPTVAAITGGTGDVCPGSTFQLSDATAGGVWTSSDNAIATVDPTSGLVTGVTGGTTNINYAVTDVSGCITTVSQSITIKGTDISVSGTTNHCVGSYIQLSTSNPGGVWSSSDNNIADLYSQNGYYGWVYGSAPGTATITYTAPTDPSGCGITTATKIVTIIAVPIVAPITGGVVCVGSATQFSDATPGGVWSTNNPAVATIDANGLVTGIAEGEVFISYVVTNAAGCTTNTQRWVKISGSALSPITGAATMCANSGISLSDATPGGVWSSSDNAVATVDLTNGYVTGVAPGTVTITYTGCSGSVTFNITVTGPTVAAITGADSFCSGSTTQMSDATAGGYWQSSDGTVATVDWMTGLVTGVNPGTATISYYVYDAVSGCSTTVTHPVTVTGPAVAAITGAVSVCPGSTFQLNDATPGGVWASSDNQVATVDVNGLVTAVAAGTVTITYAVTDGSGCITTVSKPVTIKGTDITVFYGTTSGCVNNYIYLSTSNPGGVWSTSDNTITSFMGPYSGVGIDYMYVQGLAPGTATITYTAATDPSGCGITTTSKIVTFNAVPIVAPITGGAVCVGSTTQLSDATPGGVWSTNDPAKATINATTGLVTGVASGDVWFYYMVTNASGCQTPVYKVITVNGATVAPITGATSLCAGTTTQLTDATVDGVWSSGNTSIATIDAATGLVTGIAPGTVTITYTGCNTSVIQSITVNGPVVPAITGIASVCAGSTTQLADATAGGVWSSSDNTIATVDINNGMVTGVASGTATITYTVTDGLGCTVSVTQLVTVNALSTAAAITGTASVCAGSTTQLADVTAGGVWSSGDNTKATVDAAGLVTGIAAGAVTISYTVTNGTGCVTAVTQDITVSTSPVLSVNPATQTICSGNSASVAVTGDNGAAVTWTSNYFGLTGSGIGFTTGVLTNSGTVPYSLILTAKALLGTCSDKISATVTVNPVPRVMSTPQSVTVCSYETLHIALTAILSGTTINWTIVDGSNATVASGSGINNVTITNKLSSGAYTLKVTGTKDGCTSQELSVPIVVN